MNNDDLCGKKGCLKPMAEDSEFCVVHKPKPADDILPDDGGAVVSKFIVTYYHELRESINVEARTENEAWEKAEEEMSYEGEVTHTPHKNISKKGTKVTTSDKIREENKQRWSDFQ